MALEVLVLLLAVGVMVFATICAVMAFRPRPKEVLASVVMAVVAVACAAVAVRVIDFMQGAS